MVHGMQTRNEDRMNKKKVGMVIAMLLAFLMLAACGTSSASDGVGKIQICEDGSIIQTSVAEFDKDYYSKDDLESFAKEEIQAFTASGDGTIELSSVSVENQNAELTLKFDSSETYTAFEGKNLFTGTIAQAIVAGYEPSGYLTQIQERESADASMEADKADYTLDMKVVVLEEQYEVTVPGKILWVSSVGTKVTGKSSVRVDTDELTYIIYQ
jgi:ABC-type glycerol-3-phosphate transport system substrate-binding protein